jgi:hypothetical protein
LPRSKMHSRWYCGHDAGSSPTKAR